MNRYPSSMKSMETRRELVVAATHRLISATQNPPVFGPRIPKAQRQNHRVLGGDGVGSLSQKVVFARMRHSPFV